MSNANSIAGFSQSGSTRNQFPTQTISVATETQLTISTDTGTTPCFLYVPYGSYAAGTMAPIDTNANAAIIRRANREYGLPSGEANDPYSSASWDGHPFRVRISGIGNAAAQLAAPGGLGSSTSFGGTGTLLDTTTYYYIVTAVNAQGGTSLVSSVQSQLTGSHSNTNKVTITWSAVTGAAAYNIYGRNSGGELYIAQVPAGTLTYTDDGTITPAGALPTSATSNITLNLYQGTTTLASAIATTGSVALAATAAGAFDFMIEATLMWDATSKVLSGWYKANLGYTTAVSGKNSSYTTDTVVTTVTTGVAISGLSFAASAIFGFASSANTITIRDFTIEKL